MLEVKHPLVKGGLADSRFSWQLTWSHTGFW